MTADVWALASFGVGVGGGGDQRDGMRKKLALATLPPSGVSPFFVLAGRRVGERHGVYRLSPTSLAARCHLTIHTSTMKASESKPLRTLTWRQRKSLLAMQWPSADAHRSPSTPPPPPPASPLSSNDASRLPTTSSYTAPLHYHRRSILHHGLAA